MTCFAVREFAARTEYLFTLKEESSKKVIGLIYIKELDKVEGQGEFAYGIDYNFEGKGIISKAVSELTTYAFESLNLDRLQIIVHKTNTRLMADLAILPLLLLADFEKMSEIKINILCGLRRK